MTREPGSNGFQTPKKTPRGNEMRVNGACVQELGGLILRLRLGFRLRTSWKWSFSMRAWQIKHICSEASLASCLISTPHQVQTILKSSLPLGPGSAFLRSAFILTFNCAFRTERLLIGNKIDDPLVPTNALSQTIPVPARSIKL